MKLIMETVLTFLKWGNYKEIPFAKKDEKETISEVATRVRNQADKLTSALQNPDLTNTITRITRGHS